MSESGGRSEEGARPFTVVVWGDSIAIQGGSWPALAEMLLSVVCFPGREIKFINSAQCGLPAAAAQEQFPDKVLAHCPDLVIIQFGFNDLRCAGALRPISTEDEFASHLTQMVRRCQNEARARVLVLGNHNPVSILQMPDRRSYQQTVDAYRKISVAVAKSTGADYHDMSLLTKYQFCDSELVVEDGVHLSEKGRNLYAQQIANLIQEILV